MDRVGHRQTEIKEGKPDDLIHSSMSGSGDMGCYVKGGQMDRQREWFTTELITGGTGKEMVKVQSGLPRSGTNTASASSNGGNLLIFDTDKKVITKI